MADPWHKTLVRSRLVQQALGGGLAAYLSFVHRTVRRVDADLATDDQPDHKTAGLTAHLPAIFTFWHGEHFMVGPAVPPDWGMHVMISKSADGAINAIAAERLGVATVRGAGNVRRDKKGKGKSKGGARAFLRFVDLLEAGKSVAMTADVPKIARKVSPGLIKLARKTGRPIVPVAYVTHPRITVATWDRASVALPFTRAALGTSAPIYVAEDEAGEARACDLVRARLIALEAHAYRAIGGRPAFAEDPAGRNHEPIDV